MAERPAWSVKDNKVIKCAFEFQWNSGFSVAQKKRNIVNLHESINKVKRERALEISSKSDDQIGSSLSAFNIKLNNIPLENIFQSAKRYENGGPYTDLLNVSPKDAKRDERHRNSGRLVEFVCFGEIWELEPTTAFYDYIYIRAVIQNYGLALDLSNYEWFTDIEFNPNKSVNCQARAIAIYKLLQSLNAFSVLDSKDAWFKFHRQYVNG